MFGKNSLVAFTISIVRWFCAVLILTSVSDQQYTFGQAGLKAEPDKWSAAQREVWATVEAYSEASHRRNLEEYLSFWHPDFWGWHNGDNEPTNYLQRKQGLAHYFNATTSLKYTLEPLVIQIIAEGKAAIAHYKLRNTLLNKKSSKEEAGTSYWTDYLFKEGGRWLLISDHGGGVPEEGAGNKSAGELPGWLQGKWKGVNVKPGQTAFETWSGDPNGELSGTGVTLEGKDTVFLEKLKLVFIDDTFYYVADVSHNREPTYFKITRMSDNGFVSENPQHDFPKKIAYELEGSRLTVVISGDGKSIPFHFIKIE